MLKTIATALAVVAAMVVSPAEPAAAAAPDRTGKIVFYRRGYQDSSEWIWTMNADRSRQRRVTRGDHPRWSPDGKWIAFDNWADGGDSYVFVIRADGSGLHEVAHGTYPAWSPDGAQLLFSDSTCGGVCVLTLNRLDRPPKLITDGFQTDWGANNLIAYVCTDSRQICTVHPDGTHRRQLTRDKYANFSPRWSPRGDRIAFSSDRELSCCNTIIWIVNADGTDERRVSRGVWDPAYDDHPTWSPDGTRLLVSSSRDSADGDGADLWIMKPDGSGAYSFAGGNTYDYEGSSDWRAS